MIGTSSAQVSYHPGCYINRVSKTVCTNWQSLMSSQSIFKTILSSIKVASADIQKLVSEESKPRKKADPITKDSKLVSSR